MYKRQAKHPDPFTEAKGYNGPVLLLRADDDSLVDEGTCNRYAQVYTDVYKRQASALGR